MKEGANPLERMFARLIALAVELVRGILLAPIVALKRMFMPLSVRRATIDEILALRHRVLRPGRPVDAARWDGDRDETTRHWAAWWGGEVVGVVSVIAATPPGEDAPAWQLRGMAVAPEVQGRGIGARLLQAVHDEVGEPMWCNARETALEFYTRHRWEAVGDRFDKPGIGPHFQMRWAPLQLTDRGGAS